MIELDHLSFKAVLEGDARAVSSDDGATQQSSNPSSPSCRTPPTVDKIIEIVETIFSPENVRVDADLHKHMNGRMMVSTCSLLEHPRLQSLGIVAEDLVSAGKATKRFVLEEHTAGKFFFGPLPQSHPKGRCIITLQCVADPTGTRRSVIDAIPSKEAAQDVVGAHHPVVHYFQSREANLVFVGFEDERIAKQAFLDTQKKNIGDVTVESKIRIEGTTNVLHCNQQVVPQSSGTIAQRRQAAMPTVAATARNGLVMGAVPPLPGLVPPLPAAGALPVPPALPLPLLGMPWPPFPMFPPPFGLFPPPFGVPPLGLKASAQVLGGLGPSSSSEVPVAPSSALEGAKASKDDALATSPADMPPAQRKSPADVPLAKPRSQQPAAKSASTKREAEAAKPPHQLSYDAAPFVPAAPSTSPLSPPSTGGSSIRYRRDPYAGCVKIVHLDAAPVLPPSTPSTSSLMSSPFDSCVAPAARAVNVRNGRGEPIAIDDLQVSCEFAAQPTATVYTASSTMHNTTTQDAAAFSTNVSAPLRSANTGGTQANASTQRPQKERISWADDDAPFVTTKYPSLGGAPSSSGLASSAPSSPTHPQSPSQAEPSQTTEPPAESAAPKYVKASYASVLLSKRAT